jgi:hypothetical protein
MAKCWSSKNEKSPRDVCKCSGKKFWIKCNVCEHECLKQICNIGDNDIRCLYCNNLKLCNNLQCQECHDKSFASHPRANYWYTEKNEVTARQVIKNSNNKYWFKCTTCKHTYFKQVHLVTQHNCTYCTNQELCNKDNCTTCFKKSFASNEKAKYWSTKNKLTPNQVFKNSAKKYYFDCHNCKHEFMCRLYAITSQNTWCPYCAINSSALCDEECDFCYNKSFASHPQAKHWSKKNKIKPRYLCKGTSEKYYFNCENGHEFLSSLSGITSGTWCPQCKNKTETKLLDWLQNNYKEHTIIYQPKFEWCKNKGTNRYLPFDFFIKELNLLVELDGDAHFKQVSSWEPPEVRRKNDVYKMKQAVSKNISIIRILQRDIQLDKNNWESNLKKCIKKYEKKTIVYIHNNGEYNKHKNDMRVKTV